VGCLSTKSVVDRLEEQLGETCIVIRVDVHTTLGGELRNEYHTGSVPSFVLISGDGGEIFKSHNVPDYSEIITMIDSG
jgi:hypothetical protein|tara:strand:+ start:23 stop:256 length:234 start_codon:yes stop_codon:yes gene_type:complete